MKYTVVWKRSLKQRLAEIWLNAADRDAVTRAAHRIDTILRLSPSTQGESRSGSTRLLIVFPLVVTYDIFEDDRRVEFLAVRNITPRVS